MSAAFWGWIERLGGRPDPDALDELTAVLAERGEADVVAFAEDLARALHDLDTPAHFGQRVHDVSEPDDAPAIPMSGDEFLYARCAVVAAGRETWARVVADPAAMAGRWEVADGELLLEVAPEAYERATELLWDHETAVSYETGANTGAWGEQPSGGGKWWHWLTCSSGFGMKVESTPAYGVTEHHLIRALDDDEAWRRWWTASGVPDLALYPYYRSDDADDLGGKSRVRKGKKVVQVEHSFDRARLTGPDHAAIARQAVEDVVAMLELARAKVKLPPFPPLPELPPLPPDLPDAYEEEPEPTTEELIEALIGMGMSPEDARAAFQVAEGAD